jgi:hypothetical protein
MGRTLDIFAYSCWADGIYFSNLLENKVDRRLTHSLLCRGRRALKGPASAALKATLASLIEKDLAALCCEKIVDFQEWLCYPSSHNKNLQIYFLCKLSARVHCRCLRTDTTPAENFQEKFQFCSMRLLHTEQDRIRKKNRLGAQTVHVTFYNIL